MPYWQQHDAVVERRAHTTTRLRALLWLADRYPDTAAAIYQAQAARLPLNPADRTPQRRQALAWARTLDRLGRLHPDDFHAHYRTELAAAKRKQRDRSPAAVTGRWPAIGLTSATVEGRNS